MGIIHVCTFMYMYLYVHVYTMYVYIIVHGRCRSVRSASDPSNVQLSALVFVLCCVALSFLSVQV